MNLRDAMNEVFTVEFAMAVGVFAISVYLATAAIVSETCITSAP